MRRGLRAAAALATLSLCLSAALSATLAAPARAADGDTAITHIEPTADGLKLLVSVPADASVSLSDVTVTVDGHAVDATAAPVGDTSGVRRTAILAIDTSNSMRGAKFEAAKAAAKQYLAAVPSDVYVGIVTFDAEVTTALPPTLDRNAATAVVDGLTLSRGTRLYDAVVAAVKAAGTKGQRSLLVLSDGADVSGTPLEKATSAISDADVLTDVVAVDQAASDSSLAALANAGKGKVLPADANALAATFDAEAQALARQVLVTATLPASITATDATVEVTLGDLSASAYGQIRQPSSTPQVAPQEPGPHVPDWAMYAGVAALGLGLLGLFVCMIPGATGGAGAMSAEQRVTAYTASARRQARRDKNRRPEREEVLAGAKSAAADLLKRNAGLEARIAARLDAAGSELKPAEWLLVHAGVAVLVTVVGLLLGKGNPVLALVFLAVGVAGPWVYLGMRRNARRKAFAQALPDTLQLISGSLAAGLSLGQSLNTVVENGVEPVAGEFRRVLVESRLGVSLDDALEGVADRFDSRDFDWVVMAIRIQRQVGGNLAELLDTVAATMREREYLRRQVAALSAEGKLSAWVLGLLPPLFTLYLAMTNWSYVSPLFTDPRGLVMLVGGALWLAVGVFWMSRLVKVEV